jgi:NMD protein affecting ribosome stability and mRNA decay
MAQAVRGVRTRRIAGHAQSDPVSDPYQKRRKPHEPTICRQCGALYHHGRWQWGKTPADARKELCPACRRSNDGLPAGIVTLHGAFPHERRDEIRALLRHQEEAENKDHPLNRIIAIDEAPDALVVKTSDIHLPQRLGTALKRAFHGELDMHFDAAAYLARVYRRPPA